MHRTFCRIASLCLVVGLVPAVTPAPAQTIEFPAELGIQPTYHYILKMDAYPGDLAAIVEAAGGSLFRTFPELGFAVAYSTDENFLTNMGGGNGNNIVRDVSTQWIPAPGWSAILQTPTEEVGSEASDPELAFFRPCQWYLDQIDAPGSWAAGQFGAGIKVAVLDSGVDPGHLDLNGRVDVANSTSALIDSFCDQFGIVDTTTFIDRNFHGTAVAAEISSNGLGMASVAPDSEIVGVKVLDCIGSGSFTELVIGLMYVAGLPDVQVVNMSLGAEFPKNFPGIQGGGGLLIGFLNAALSFTEDSGKLLVASAGNGRAGIGVNMDKDQQTHWAPAQNTGVLAAWAGDFQGNLAGYSNFGRSGTWVGAGGGTSGGISPPLPGCFFPPGGQSFNITACATTTVLSSLQVCTTAPNFYFGVTGTSFSAPLVAGVAAVAQSANGNSFAPGDLRAFLKNTADDLGKPGRDVVFSHGRVNAFRAATE